MPTDADCGIPMTESQRRAVGVALALLDETLCRFEEWGRGRQVRSVLYEERNALPAERRASLVGEVARMRSVVAELKDGLLLPVQTCSAEDDIWSRCAILRESLMEIEGGGLRGYGEVHPDLARAMEDAVPRLLDGLDRTAGLVAHVRGAPQRE